MALWPIWRFKSSTDLPRSRAALLSAAEKADPKELVGGVRRDKKHGHPYVKG